VYARAIPTDVRIALWVHRALFRFEFMEGILRLALSKYLDSGGRNPSTPAAALELLMSVNVLPVLGPHGSEPVHRVDEWRQRWLYTCVLLCCDCCACHGVLTTTACNEHVFGLALLFRMQ